MEEIDLRKYVDVLLTNWKWLLLGAAVPAVVALVVSFLLPPTYLAGSLVAATQARQVMQFDPRYETVPETKVFYLAYPELAMSDGMLQELLLRVDSDFEDAAELRRVLEVTAGKDSGIIRLMAKSKSADAAAEIANIWADLVVAQINTLYSAHGEEQVDFLERQLVQAEEELTQAQGELVAFQARSRVKILANQLDAHTRTQADHLAAQQAIDVMVRDLASLRDLMGEQPAGQPPELADQLTTLFLQLQAFGAQSRIPVEFQVGSDQILSSKNTEEQIAFLSDLGEGLEAERIAIDGRLSELEPMVLAAQQQLQQERTEEERLIDAKSLARETYLILSRKLDEALIAAQDTSGEVRLASYASPPDKPDSPKKLYNMVLGGALGLVAGVCWLLATAWWRDWKGTEEV